MVSSFWTMCSQHSVVLRTCSASSLLNLDMSGCGCCSVSVRERIKTRSCIALSLGDSVVDLPFLACGFTMTLLTNPSPAVVTSVIVPVGHSSLGEFFSLISTVSPTFAFSWMFTHWSLFVPMLYIYSFQYLSNSAERALILRHLFAPYAARSLSE